MSICSLDPPDLSRNSTADVALEHWGRRGGTVKILSQIDRGGLGPALL